MPVLSTDIQLRLSGGAGNSDQNASLGGAKSSNQASSSLFDTVNSTESGTGDTEYRCVYVHNNSGTNSLDNPVVWITAENPNYIDIGVGTSAVNATEQTVANENTAPVGVTFSSPTSKGAGLALGSIPAGQHRAIWIRRTVPVSAPNSAADFALRVEGDTLP